MNLKISAREKKLLTVLLVLLVGFLFFNFIYQPQQLTLMELKSQLEQKKLQYDRIQQLLKEKKAWEQSNSTDQQLSVANLLEQVNLLAVASGVEMKAFRPEEKAPQEGKTTDDGKQVVLQITVEGSFASLESFFVAWEKSVQGGVLTSLEITPVEGADKLQANLIVKALL